MQYENVHANVPESETSQNLQNFVPYQLSIKILLNFLLKNLIIFYVALLQYLPT